MHALEAARCQPREERAGQDDRHQNQRAGPRLAMPVFVRGNRVGEDLHGQRRDRLRYVRAEEPVVERREEQRRRLAGDAREGALALGATRARAVFSVVLPAALPGIVTGAVLALARIAGETAPLLFTAFNNRFFSTSLRQPISSLTVQVYTYATGPYEDWHRQAWAGALVLVSIVLICSLLARLATRRLERMHARG